VRSVMLHHAGPAVHRIGPLSSNVRPLIRPSMHPDISEFSYGYALTESLIRASPFPIKAAPIFPSLIDEGRVGGYDVHLPFEGFPLFLQFKLSHHMVRGTAGEAKKGLLTPPFYRMHLRPTKHSQQHPLLLATEATGVAVYYVAPCFHEPDELNAAYTAQQVVQRSVFVKPSTIGPLPDHDDHHIAFNQGTGFYLCSDDPKLILEKGQERRAFLEDLEFGFDRREKILLTEQSAQSWANRLREVIKGHRPRWLKDKDLDAIKADRSSLSQFAYMANTFLGCTVIIVAPRQQPNAEA